MSDDSQVMITLTDVEKVIPNLEVIGLEDKVVAYRFRGGMYAGLSFTYANIRFNVVEVETGQLVDMKPEDVEPGDERYALSVGFEYVIIENPAKKDVDADHFKEYIGAILVRIIEASVEEHGVE